MIDVSTLFGFMFLILMFYVFLTIWNPIVNTLLYPILDNVAYGSVIKLLFQLGPLVIAFLIFAYPWLQSKIQQWQIEKYQ